VEQKLNTYVDSSGNYPKCKFMRGMVMVLVKRALLIIAFSTLSIVNHFELSVLALNQPKRKEDTCADLQKIANRVGQDGTPKYTFQGFEDLPMRTNVYSEGVTTRGTDRLCQLGYFTITSPMGKKICRGHIYTNTESSRIRWDIGYFRKTFYDPANRSSEFCRYIN
jgi:hypothetical protein